jgi:hypothetical protein
VNCASHHTGLNWEAYSTLDGQYRVGLDPQGHF